MIKINNVNYTVRDDDDENDHILYFSNFDVTS